MKRKKDPFVEIVEAQKIPMRSSIRTHGTVRPRTSTTLIAEVPGIIQQVAPFAETKIPAPSISAPEVFSKKNELLLKIEDMDLGTMEAEALANLRRVELHWMQEKNWQSRRKSNGASGLESGAELVRRVPQIEKAIAETKAAEARLTQASRFEPLKRKSSLRGQNS